MGNYTKTDDRVALLILSVVSIAVMIGLFSVSNDYYMPFEFTVIFAIVSIGYLFFLKSEKGKETKKTLIWANTVFFIAAIVDFAIKWGI